MEMPEMAAEARSKKRPFSLRVWESLGSSGLNLFAVVLLFFYLFPIVYMVSTSFMTQGQLRDRYAPPYPAQQTQYEYQGEELPLFNVPIDGEIRQLAMVERGRLDSVFIDPEDLEAGLIQWEGSWRLLRGVYHFEATWENFQLLFRSVPFVNMASNTLTAALISGVGVIFSSVLVAYGFARFPLPGGDLLFYVLIATMLIPEKVTLIPTYYFFVRVLEWNGSWLPILIPFFFGNAVLIFLMRQNFKSIPKEMEEAAMLDGAGPLRILFQIVLPQSWPVIITAILLHFFYIWNETRQAALYLASARDLVPISFGIQNFQSLSPTQNLLQASALVIMIVPVIVLLFMQRYFMRNLIITGMEK
jgi:multiple sugar transport system permease protein